MRFLFIIHDVYQDDNEFPLGVAYLASILRDKGHEVSVYCMDVYHYTNKQLADYLDKNEFDFIGLGFMAARFTETILPLCKVINKHKKNAYFVLGGHGPSPIPGYILSKAACDGVVVGEAEGIIANADEFISKRRNIIYGHPIKKLDELPYPAWDLFPMEIYTTCIRNPGMNDNDKMIAMMSSRGCVNACTFCYRMEKGLRLRKIDKVVEEMKILNDRYGVNYFEFADECFIMNEKRLLKFQQSLKENNLDIKYWCAARVDLVNEELLKLMKDTGCVFINYGFESMNQEVLKEMKKNTTPKQNRNAAELTKKLGISFGVNFIWGYPSDTLNTLKQNMEFIIEYNSPYQCRTIRPVIPYPGSELYYDAINKGLLDGADDFFNRFNNSDLITVNFTRYTDEQIYKALFDVNCLLIKDHQEKADISNEKAYNLMRGFQKLYFNKEYKFRGARKYERET